MLSSRRAAARAPDTSGHAAADAACFSTYDGDTGKLNVTTHQQLKETTQKNLNMAWIQQRRTDEQTTITTEMNQLQ